MLIAESTRDINQAARAAAKFLKEQGIELPHAKALDMVARMAGKPHHMAAQAGLASSTQPAVPAPRARSAQDFAIEHAGYLVNSAEHLLKRLNEVHAAQEALEEADDADIEAREGELTAATDSLAEAIGSLRSSIYEFEKRRDRALAQASAAVNPGSVGPRNAPYSEEARSVIEDLCKVLTHDDVSRALYNEGISDAADTALAAAAPFVRVDVLAGFGINALKQALDDIPADASGAQRDLAEKLKVFLPKETRAPVAEDTGPLSEEERLALQFELATGEPASIAREVIADNGLQGAATELNKRYEIGLSIGPWLIANSSGFWCNGFGWCSSRHCASGFSSAELAETIIAGFGNDARAVRYDEVTDFSCELND